MLMPGFAVAGALAIASTEFDALVVVAFWVEVIGAAMFVIVFDAVVGALGFRFGSVPSFAGVG
jgi:hypothetical protein